MSPNDTAASFSWFRARLGVARADGGQLFLIYAPAKCSPNDTAASFS